MSVSDEAPAAAASEIWWDVRRAKVKNVVDTRMRLSVRRRYFATVNALL